MIEFIKGKSAVVCLTIVQIIITTAHCAVLFFNILPEMIIWIRIPLSVIMGIPIAFGLLLSIAHKEQLGENESEEKTKLKKLLNIPFPIYYRWFTFINTLFFFGVFSPPAMEVGWYFNAIAVASVTAKTEQMLSRLFKTQIAKQEEQSEIERNYNELRTQFDDAQNQLTELQKIADELHRQQEGNKELAEELEYYRQLFGPAAAKRHNTLSAAASYLRRIQRKSKI